MLKLTGAHNIYAMPDRTPMKHILVIMLYCATQKCDKAHTRYDVILCSVQNYEKSHISYIITVLYKAQMKVNCTRYITLLCVIES